MATELTIVLTGFMGTGKSTVGRLLAERLGLDFVDTDVLIEQRHGPIPEIFSAHGEARFREIEREVAAELARRNGIVVSTGGRMMLDPINVTAFAGARVFCLTADADEILARIENDSSPIKRPLLAVGDPRRRIVELLEEREQGYLRFETVPTGGRSPAEIADGIIDALAVDG